METNYRIEHDLLGELPVPADAYYGIHTLRAMHNFHLSGAHIHPELIKALATVKKAAAFCNHQLGLLSDEVYHAIDKACDEIIAGKLHEQFVVDALQGGAGTSANMNANEVIANRALELMGKKKGEYKFIHPLDHVNESQSTNDVVPTAICIAAIRLLKPVSEKLADLQTSLQDKENEFAAIVKLGRTQLQDAVPITVGQEFGAWAQAIARDRWRIYKSEERLRHVNIGGTAIGTGINADKKFIFTVTDKLRELTGLGLARADNLIDATQNTDVFVEVSGLLKTAAVSLIKICNDLRLLSSGPRSGIGELRLPKMQAGSSIMPGKVNPVIPEAMTQAAFQVIGNDLTITFASQAGQMELNAFLPLVAHNLFQQMELLSRGVEMLNERCIKGIEVDVDRCTKNLEHSLALVTALDGYIGYEGATHVADVCMRTGKTVREVLLSEGLVSADKIDSILNAYDMTKPGIPGKK